MAGEEFYSLLSDGERRLLTGIEERFTAADPRLARRLTRVRPSAAARLVVILAFLLSLVGAFLATTAASTSVARGYAGLALIIVSFGACLFGIRRGA